VTGPDVNLGRAQRASTSLSLLARAKAGAAGSWEQLVGLYTPLVYHWCRQSRLTAVDAEDVGQEVFRAVYRNLGRFRRDNAGDSFRAWLRRITQTKVIDFARKKDVQPQGIGGSAAARALAGLAAGGASDSADLPADDGASADERRILFRQALKQLEPAFAKETWQAFWRVVAEGLAPATVARDLGMTVNAVYLAKSRVLRRFREEFANLVEPGPRV
jgi:RNA polymerase sigma-70 factor (ECF subfamily)